MMTEVDEGSNVLPVVEIVVLQTPAFQESRERSIESRQEEKSV